MDITTIERYLKCHIHEFEKVLRQKPHVCSIEAKRQYTMALDSVNTYCEKMMEGRSSIMVLIMGVNVSSGAFIGICEALELMDGGKEYLGKGVSIR
ncbi:hypothetical protein IGI04_015896 [Brassica rapa subsp. trilocularis]|uniref:Uncharacterized protein n=1 Tax=Brassica rapa subsp. trilocularis TaxID=1813537 RepID=A0ABQ7MRF5_BRACM|nr:hypothetical protein IGI04_015896 [Brassica rapa subsp. trilocularis]